MPDDERQSVIRAFVDAFARNDLPAMRQLLAERRGRSLHNFSGQLVTVESGVITELWMVDALPAESDAFWSS
jgi:hypothetical protein